MKLIGVSVVKNEQDIIEAFIRHNLNYLDALFIIDNNSTDKTRDVLSLLLQENLPIVILDDPSFGHFQSQKLTTLCHHVDHFFQPDYVFFLDADEFIKVESRDTLEHQLDSLPSNSVGVLRWQNYVFSPFLDLADSHSVRRMPYRLRQEALQHCKVVIGRYILDQEDYVIGQGNHHVELPEQEAPTHYILDSVYLAHFPVRHPKQVANKVLNGWLARLLRTTRIGENTQAFHWQGIYDRLLLDPKLSMAETCFISLLYGQPIQLQTFDILKTLDLQVYFEELCTSDPIVVVDNLCYTEVDPPHSTIALARNFESWIQTGFNQDQSYLCLPEIKSTISHSEALSKQRRYKIEGDPSILKHVVEKFSPQSVLDLGCGTGYYLQQAAELGIQQLQGLESPESEIVLTRYAWYDDIFVTPLTEVSSLPRSYQLSICLNVLDFESSWISDHLLTILTQYTEDLILFSVQDVSKIQNWIQRFKTLGWSTIGFDSLVLRMLSGFSWSQNSIILLTKSEYIGVFPDTFVV